MTRDSRAASGKPRHHALQMRKLLVEITAQSVELLRLAQFLGADHLVEFRGERPIIRTARFVSLIARPPRLGGSFRIPHLGVVGHFGGRRVDGLRGAIGQFICRSLGLSTHLLAFGGIRRFAILARFVLVVLLVALFTVLFVGFA
jgi:hypothetical protein